MKHTAGRWKIARHGKDEQEIDIEAKYSICSMLYTGHPADIEANARLIAAAPDLLEAGEQILSALADIAPAYKSINLDIAKQRMIAAIARTKGRE
jgi:hypothetical protein